jgi:hypothetical protein
MTSDPQRQRDVPNSQKNLPAAPRIVALFLLFATAGVFEARNLTSLSALTNADIWWHLRTGIWILQNHALPHAGLFSQSPDSHWIAASWVYDLKLAIWYKLLGLASIPVFSISFKAALAVITFLLAGGRRGNFWPAVVVSAITQYILASVPATPLYCSVVLFELELLLLLKSRRDSSVSPLFWLPLLFLMWANVDPHFIYGLVLLALFLAALAAERWLPVTEMRQSDGEGCSSDKKNRTPDHLLTKNLAGVAAVSVLATLFTPYFYHPYGVFFSTAFSGANPYLPDYRAPGFRQPQDYALLLFGMSAFLALGLRRSRDPFLISLLASSAALSFHSERDLWLVVMAASAVMGKTIVGAEPAGAKVKQDQHLLIAVGATIVILALASAILIPHRPEALLAKTSQSYPVAAADYIREHHLPQPLFNAFEWGGFLTWYLPEYPVAIDGRIDLYGDDFIVGYSKVMNVEARHIDFPAMANAATIVLPRSAIMAQALSSLPAYKVAYSDNVATVLTKNLMLSHSSNGDPLLLRVGN